MSYEDKTSNDTIVVNDKLLAAALIVMGHQVYNVYQYEGNDNAFYGLFKITASLRKDIKDYNGIGLCVNIKMVSKALDDLNVSLGEYLYYLQSELENKSKTLSIYKHAVVS